MSDEQPSEPEPSNGENGYIPGDGAFKRWHNTFRALTGKMTREGQLQWKRDMDDRNEQSDIEKCKKYREFLLQYSPIIVFLREKINQLGGDINSSNIRIRKCHELKGGGFDSDYGISICSNNMRSRSHMEDTLAHEMIHAYDHLRFQVQWRNNLRHAACSEIRASTLSGECRWAVEFFGKNQWKFSQHLQDCVKRRAVLSVAGRPNCKDDVEAAKVVNEVWDSCFPDTRPFDEVYR